MKIKWLLDVCLSPGQELHLWEMLQDPQTEKITAQQLFMFPRAPSHHLTEKSPGLSLCCLCPLIPCLFLSSCCLSQMITQHTFKGPA